MFGLIRSGMATAMHELSVVSNNIANEGQLHSKRVMLVFLICIRLQLPTLCLELRLVKAQTYILHAAVKLRVV